mgnify:CR=1 FL=1
MADPAALTIDGLTKRFGGLVAVDDISIAFEPGKLNAVIGPNGAGKTTLFNLICGELRADAGRITFNGRSIAGLKPHQIVRCGISRTLQIKSVFAGLTVRENVCAAVMAHEQVRSFIRPVWLYDEIADRVTHLIDEVGLSPFADRLASTLSYGDVALLELALALANNPKLLLLDEPVCGMGPEETERTVAIIRDISERTNVILIEHDMEVVFAVADEIVVMAQGRLLARGTPAEISSNAQVQEAYLGAPDDEV